MTVGHTARSSGTMGDVDLDMFVQCPQCGAQLWIPVRMEVTPQNTMRHLWFDEQAFYEAVARHVSLNPGLHQSTHDS